MPYFLSHLLLNKAEVTNNYEILRFQTRIGLFFIDCFADSVQTDRPQVSALSYIPGTIIIMNNKNYKCNNNNDNNNNNNSNTLIKQSFVKRLQITIYDNH